MILVASPWLKGKAVVLLNAQPNAVRPKRASPWAVSVNT